MAPSLAAGNHADCARRNRIVGGDPRLGFARAHALANFENVACGEFGSAVPLSLCSPALSLAILHVVFLRTKEKVVGVHTRGCVAAMKDLIAGGKLAMMDSPRDAMGEKVSAAASANLAIPLIVDGAVPKPASVCLVNECSKARSYITALDRPTAAIMTAMPPKPDPVSIANRSVAARWLATSINRAYSMISHFDLLSRLSWLEPVEARQRSAGSLFIHGGSATYKPEP